MGALRYADALAEARAEFDAWLARQPMGAVICACGRKVSCRRGSRCSVCIALAAAGEERCECGGTVFARGLCRPCYFKDYNRRNPGQRRVSPKPGRRKVSAGGGP